MTLEQAINHAAEHLPPGAEIHICVEKESGWVDAMDWDGNWREFDCSDMCLSEQVTDCLQWCIEQEPDHEGSR